MRRNIVPGAHPNHQGLRILRVRPIDPENIHLGPSDYVPWQNDNKVCFLRMECQLFGGVSMNLEMRLSVEDSPNSAGVAIDLIRCARLAKDRGLAGPVKPAAAYFCKHPLEQMTDDDAWAALEDFIHALPDGTNPRPKSLDGREGRTPLMSAMHGSEADIKNRRRSPATLKSCSKS